MSALDLAYFLYDDGGDFCGQCARLCEEYGFRRKELGSGALFALAPRLKRRIDATERNLTRFGLLVFHPSILPYRRGPDAIRWSAAAKERVSGVTWFWANDGLDEGDICVQEPVLMSPSESPGCAYHTRFVPAGLRALERSLQWISAGQPLRIPQDEALATYDGKFPVESTRKAL